MTTNPTLVVDRHRELADFLRTRRARLAPRDVGLPAGTRRRTPGLRREELAQLAGLSVDWYTRLEQGRDVTPSRETLEAIAIVLKLDEVERGHLFFLARPEGRPRVHSEVAEPALVAAIEAMKLPALVLSPRFDVLAWNHGLSRLMLDLSLLPAEARNIVRLTFLEPRYRARYRDIDTIERLTVAAFRANAATFVGHPDFDALAAELLAASPSFARHWARHDVQPKVGGTKVFRSPDGDIALDWHALKAASGSLQEVVFYVPRPGSDDEARLAKLMS